MIKSCLGHQSFAFVKGRMGVWLCLHGNVVKKWSAIKEVPDFNILNY
jgi:hypothetical protein